MKKVDQLIGYITWLYLGLPILIFFISWLRIGFALPLSALFIWGMLAYLSRLPSDRQPGTGVDKKTLVLVMGLAFVWVFLSGIGGFSNQDWDHHFRNALFRDLITEPWPVYYVLPTDYPIDSLANQHTALNYYFTFWLPAAWIGKLFGQSVGNLCLLGWSFTGILLSLYYLNRLFAFKYAGFVTLLFMLWSGLDLLGKLILQGHLVYPGEQIELYYHYYYTAFTTDLYNPFNQAIPAWLITAWVMNYPRTLNLLPVTCLFAYAPFPFIGLSLLTSTNAGWEALTSGMTGKTFVRSWLARLGRMEALGALGLFVTYALFYQAHTSYVRSGLFWTRYAEADSGPNLNMAIAYLVTFFLEAGVYFSLIFLLSRRIYQAYKRPFWLCFGLLILFPLWAVGEYNDFASRGSIPVLLVVCVLTAKAIIDHWSWQPNRSILLLTASLLVLTWVTPVRLLLRSVPLDGRPRLRDSIGTFRRPNVDKGHDNEGVLTSVANFYAQQPQQQVFYKYLAKPLR